MESLASRTPSAALQLRFAQNDIGTGVAAFRKPNAFAIQHAPIKVLPFQGI
jgi:hypothetical protein